MRVVFIIVDQPFNGIFIRLSSGNSPLYILYIIIVIGTRYDFIAMASERHQHLLTERSFPEGEDF